MDTMSSDHAISIRGQAQTDGSLRRFGFGKNWRRFLDYLTDTRIEEAKKSLCAMIGTQDLNGSSFLDIGCGSGLFSLAAMQLGASRVYSFDFDPQSVACTHELK
ncbi:MAG TPA: 50S ribosomal protein L11 methyltransferase, partial [Bryobacteraceae bacterium]|nr:50S ribosomal protein L11 methyltransferase [Bryobacteraceae bacterium]